MEQRRNGLWGKLKGSYGSVGSAFSNLSLSSSEQDGDSESDTVIHHALVRFYQNRDGRVPPWLAIETPSNGYQTYNQPMHASGAPGGAQGVPGAPVRSHSTALQEMYRRRQQQREQLQQQQGGTPDAVPMRSSESMTRLQSYQGAAPTLNRAQSYGNEIDRPSSSQSDRFKSRLRAGGAARANW